MNCPVHRLSRRDFLQLVGAGTAAVISGCSCEKQPTPEPLVQSGALPGSVSNQDVPWSIWRSARDAVRASPDHLDARAAELVNAKDAEAIFAFVRDRIELVPPQDRGFGNALTQTRFGTRAALRCGRATPREKAELLAELLSKAGFPAEVVQASLAAGLRAQDLLQGVEVPPFEPAVADAELEDWVGRMGAKELPPPALLDAGGADSAALAEGLRTQLHTTRLPAPFDWSLGALPVVRATVGGAELILNPLLRDASLEDARVSGVMPGLPAVPLSSVEFELQVASSAGLTRRRRVCSASWPVDRLVGRRVVARFVPTGDSQQAIALPAAQLHVFTPVLALEGPELEPGAAADCVLGDAVSLGGSVIKAQADGTLLIDEEPVGVANTPVASSIATLAMEVNAAEFPRVRLLLSPRDASGKPVAGVSAAALTVYEDGRPVQFMLRQAAPPPPKLLLLLDTSRSLPESFRRHEAARFAGELQGLIQQQFPGALMRVATINYGVATAIPSWTVDPAQVQADAARLVGDGSEIWAALEDAQQYGANLIALVTDGQASDTPGRIAAATRSIAVGPPIVAIGAGDVRQETLDELARVSRGSSARVSEPEQAAQAILRSLADREDVPLHLEYRAPEEGPAERVVKVVASAAEASGTYQVPAVDERLAGPMLAGVYLVVRYQGREVIRTLGGILAESAAQPLRDIAEAAAEARAAMFGAAVVSVEAGVPTLAAWLDDIFTSRLALQPLAGAGSDAASLLQALTTGAWHLPPELLALHAAFTPDSRSSQFETAPRMVMLVDRPTADGHLERFADWLPLAGTSMAADDPELAYLATLRSSSRAAVAGRELYQETAASLLAGREMRQLAAGEAAPRDGAGAGFARLLDAWSACDRLTPRDEGPFAFWAVTPAGMVFGVTGHNGMAARSTVQTAGCAFAAGVPAADILAQGYLLPAGVGAAAARIAAGDGAELKAAIGLPAAGTAAAAGSSCAPSARRLLCSWAADGPGAIFEDAAKAAATNSFLALTRGDRALDC